MTSRLRPLTVFSSIIILTVFGLISYDTFIKQELTEFNIKTFGAAVFLLCFIGGIIVIFFFTVIVKADLQRSQLTLFYPFRLKRIHLDFDDILGFRFKYLPAKNFDYKALQVKTKSGQTFSFSDYETANLRDFENLFMAHFELRRGKSFNELSQEEREYEIQKSREFDIEQAKSIRFMLFLYIFLFSIILLITAKTHVDNRTVPSLLATAGLLSLSMVLTSLLSKLNKIRKTINNSEISRNLFSHPL